MNEARLKELREKVSEGMDGALAIDLLTECLGEIESLKKEVEWLRGTRIPQFEGWLTREREQNARLRSALEQARERLDCVPQGDSLPVDEAYKDIEEALGNAQTEEK